MELIRRYAKLLREETARHAGPRIGARRARAARQGGGPGRTAREAATRAALSTGRPAKPAS